ncbi:MAG: DNA polymerase I, partial [Bacteroidales bacterium]|nr:DNA polymerase I [Bacteroidales bacterium]
MTKKLFLIDAMGLIYRAYYAMVRSPRITSQGVNTSALFGFTNSLYEVLQKEKPTHIAVAFDTHSPTVRHVDFAAYKANRQATPEDIIHSVPQIKNLLEAWNIPVIEKDGYEADDIIGTLCKQAEIAGFEVYMMTSDKDYGQLVSDHIFMYKPAKFGQPTEVVDVAKICEKYAIQKPEQLIDILGLMGDASDNIPGVPNIGEVKAKKLIAQFGSIENIYQNIQLVDNDKTRQTLIDNQEQAMMSKSLATIILDVPIVVDFEAMTYQDPDKTRLQELFQEWEFKTLGSRILNSFGKTGVSSPNAKTNTPRPQIPDLFSDLTEENMYAPDRFDSYTRFQDKTHCFNILTDNELDSFFTTQEPLAFELICSKNSIKGFMIGKADAYRYLLYDSDPQLFENLLKKVMQSGQQLVTYSCKSIYKFLRQFEIEARAAIYDLQIAHYLIQPEHSHELGRLCEHYLNYSLLETDNSLEDAINNAGEKTEVYIQIYTKIQQELKEVEGEALFQNIEMPLAEVLANMEHEGVFIDKKMLQESSREITEYIQQLEKQIFELSGERFNIASPKQMGEMLFGKLHIIENAKLTKSKQYQTGEEVLN